MNAKPFLLSLMVSGAAVFSCWADTIYMSDGTEVNGTVVEENTHTVALKRANGSITSIRRSDIETIVYEKKSKVAEEAPPPRTFEVKTVQVKPAVKTVEPKTDIEAVVKVPQTGTPVKIETVPVASPTENKPDPTLTAEAKPSEPVKNDPKSPGQGDKKDEAGKKDGDPKKVAWTPPTGLPGFPDKAKRMPVEKEEKFKLAIERMATVDEPARAAAKSEILNMGPDVLPYVVAGINHVNVEARSSCMSLVGQLNGRSAVKQVIEVFYSVMPEKDAAPSFQVPFVRAIKETLTSISGQSFISVQPDKALVLDGLKKYVAWYNDNYDRLPKQLGEPEIEPTDPEYAKKLKEARALKLAKKEWPRPPMPSDIITGSKQPPASDSERPADKKFKDSIPTISREEATKRR